jgi:hypothetical protein
VKLVTLDPSWVGAGGDGITTEDGRPVPERSGVGISFNCPCGCDHRAYVAFQNPLDGGPPEVSPGQPTWARKGSTFETLSLTPSILRGEPCQKRWHGFIIDGDVMNA